MLLVDGNIYISGACINTTGACIKLYLVHVFMTLVHVSIYYWSVSTSMNLLKMCRGYQRPGGKAGILSSISHGEEHADQNRQPKK